MKNYISLLKKSNLSPIAVIGLDEVNRTIDLRALDKNKTLPGISIFYAPKKIIKYDQNLQQLVKYLGYELQQEVPSEGKFYLSTFQDSPVPNIFWSYNEPIYDPELRMIKEHVISPSGNLIINPEEGIIKTNGDGHKYIENVKVDDLFRTVLCYVCKNEDDAVRLFGEQYKSKYFSHKGYCPHPSVDVPDHRAIVKELLKDKSFNHFQKSGLKFTQLHGNLNNLSEEGDITLVVISKQDSSYKELKTLVNDFTSEFNPENHSLDISATYHQHGISCSLQEAKGSTTINFYRNELNLFKWLAERNVGFILSKY